MNELQKEILSIVVDFDQFCKNNDITYFLMGGSALGAIRHRGFIPWDDDLDVFMTYDNYCKFIKLCENGINDKYYFEKENTKQFPLFFCKIKKNGTTLIENNIKNSDFHQGIYIDIMCLNYVSNNNIIRKLQYYVAGMLKAKANLKNGYQTKSKKKKILMFISNIIVNFFTKPLFLKFVRKNNKKKTNVLAHYFGRAKYKNSCYSSKWFQSAKYVEFENVTLPVCNGVNEYLESRFGPRFMEMPDENTRAQYQSHALYWNVNLDYKDYLNSLDNSTKNKK